MSHEEVADLLGAFALDAVDGRDKDAVRNHLDECPRCQAELSEYHEVAGCSRMSEESDRPRSGTG